MSKEVIEVVDGIVEIPMFGVNISYINNVPIEYKPYPAGDPLGGYANTVLMERLLDWKPRISLDEGIREYCEWVKDNRNIMPAWI